MKRVFKLFVLMPAEQRIVIVLVLLLVIGAWYKHHRDIQNSLPLQQTRDASPTPVSARPPN